MNLAGAKTKHTSSSISDVSHAEWTAVPMQGSGTFSVEAVLQTSVPRNTDKKVEYDIIFLNIKG